MFLVEPSMLQPTSVQALAVRWGSSVLGMKTRRCPSVDAIDQESAFLFKYFMLCGPLNSKMNRNNYVAAAACFQSVGSGPIEWVRTTDGSIVHVDQKLINVPFSPYYTIESLLAMASS